MHTVTRRSKSDPLVVRLVGDHLRRQVIHRPAHRHPSAIVQSTGIIETPRDPNISFSHPGFSEERVGPLTDIRGPSSETHSPTRIRESYGEYGKYAIIRVIPLSGVHYVQIQSNPDNCNASGPDQKLQLTGFCNYAGLTVYNWERNTQFP
jgi:hypothetical protein